MRFAVILFAALCIILCVNAAPEKSSEESSGDCHEESLNLTVKRGEVGHPEGQCVRVHCSEDGETRVEPCEFAVPPNCRVVDGDLTKEFPACCPTLACTDA